MLQPIGKRILIEEIKEELKQGLIIIKDDSTKKYKVLSIGDEVTKIAPNDIVVIVSYAQQTIKIDDKSYIILEQESIIAKVI